MGHGGEVIVRSMDFLDTRPRTRQEFLAGDSADQVAGSLWAWMLKIEHVEAFRECAAMLRESHRERKE